MGNFFKDAIYISICSLAIFIIGLFVPRTWFNAESGWFRTKNWENGGKIYNKFGISKWKGKLPDMSKYTKRLLTKKLKGIDSINGVENLISETCVAETAHILLCFLSIGMIVITKDLCGVLCCIAYTIGNVPYIMIQRYNRPRLLKMINKIDSKKI